MPAPGPRWRYRDADDGREHRPLGRAGARKPRHVRDGAFSAIRAAPLRADADVLAKSAVADLGRGFQVADANPLVGVSTAAPICCAGSAELVPQRPDIFARAMTRRGPAACSIISRRRPMAARIAAPAILSECLTHLGPIWPSRLELAGIAARRLLAASGAQDATTRPTGSCRCTSCRNGWPIR